MDIPITNPRLLSLPNEVLTIVCTDTELSVRDMCAIRLACRELHAIVLKDFATRYFQDPFVMMTKESLKALVDICKHPVFGPCVCKVQLLNYRFDAYRLQNLVEVVIQAINGRDTVQAKPRMREMEWVMQRIEEQFDFEESGEALQLLTEAFESLAATKKSIAIASQRPNSCRPPIGWTQIFQDHVGNHHSDYTLVETDMFSAFRLMLMAAEHTNCKISKLEAGVGRFDPYYTFGRDGGFPAFQTFSRPLLADVEELNFEFDCRSEQGGHPNIRAIEHLSHLALCMPRGFKTLSVRSDTDTLMMLSYFGGSLVQSIFPVLRVETLENVNLSGLSLHEHDLLNFLRNHKTSMKKLTLEKMYLVGDWDLVLAQIARAFHLVRFTIDEAYKVYERRNHTWGSIHVDKVIKWYLTACRLDDKEQMRSSLEAFVESQNEEREAIKRRELEAKKQRERDHPPRRSSRLAKKKAPADQTQ